MGENLPWRVREVIRHVDDGSTELVRTEIVDATNCVVIADVRGERAHADRLVLVVNCHDAMVDILRDSAEILDVAIDSREELIGEKDDVMRDLRRRVRSAVLSAVEGR